MSIYKLGQLGGNGPTHPELKPAAPIPSPGTQFLATEGVDFQQLEGEIMGCLIFSIEYSDDISHNLVRWQYTYADGLMKQWGKHTR